MRMSNRASKSTRRRMRLGPMRIPLCVLVLLIVIVSAGFTYFFNIAPGESKTITVHNVGASLSSAALILHTTDSQVQALSDDGRSSVQIILAPSLAPQGVSVPTPTPLPVPQGVSFPTPPAILTTSPVPTPLAFLTPSPVPAPLTDSTDSMNVSMDLDVGQGGQVDSGPQVVILNDRSYNLIVADEPAEWATVLAGRRFLHEDEAILFMPGIGFDAGIGFRMKEVPYRSTCCS